MKFLTNKSLLSKAKSMWKTIVVLILSVLLFNPTPALAFNLNNFVNSIKSGDLNQTVNELQKVDLNKIDLNKVDLKQVVNVVNDIRNTVNPPANVAPSLDYNKELQSYLSKLKVDFNRILDSIRKLSSLPEKEGQESLAAIESQLQELQNDSSSRAKQFDTWSSEQEKASKKILNDINNMYQEQETLKKQVKEYEAEIPLLEEEAAQADKQFFQNLIGNLDGTGTIYVDRDLLNKASAKSEELDNKKRYLASIPSRIETLKRNQTKLENDNKKIGEAVVLANKMSSFCNKSEKKIDLAKEKLGIVKAYADVVPSFNDSDILGEISELDEMLAKLTDELSNVS
ncbi:hypothetical protein [Aphanizomenon sp. UHCC 0183]|uniref:hypothetical protein n=1 Tax=Aphanizomenon sp. UHCC 0183 TaxID=2590028 RepID=UPI00144529BD|nr:hypothetical protein [Aphanizomenon sp. UHCC 0183]